MQKPAQWRASGGQMDLLLAVVLKPFAALVILVPALMLAAWIHRRMPDSKLKRILFSPLPGHRQRSRWAGAPLNSREVGREKLK